MNIVDNVVGFFSPEAGFKRMQYRHATNVLGSRGYEAATKGRRTSGWKTSGGSANTEIGASLSTVRDRVRALVRDNPHAGRAVSLIESYIVGTGIMSSIGAPGDRQKANLRAIWKAWSDSTDCDVDGIHNFYGLQSLAARTTAESGECLVVRRWRKLADLSSASKGGYRIPVPFQIQVLEGDYIDTSKEMMLSNGGMILKGIEFDKRNRRVAYWLYNQHPGESALSTRLGLLSKRVDAADVSHLYRADRSGQVRGMSWGSPCVIRHYDLDSYEDAQLLRQRIAASFAGYIKDIEMPDDLDQTKADVFPEDVEAGAIELLPRGKDIVFPNVPTVQNDGHTERVLRSMAMGWGVSYEGLTGDYSRVSFSSYKGTMIDQKRQVGKWQWHMFIPRFNEPVFRWFLEATELTGKVSTDGATVLWTPPRFEMLDPAREIPAIVTGIRAGLQTLPEAIREQGYDVDEHFAELKKANELIDENDLLLDSDPRKVMKTGILQVPTAEELSPKADSGSTGG